MVNLVALILAAAVPSAPATTAGPDRGAAYYHYSLGLQARFTGDSDTALAEYRRAQALDSSSAAVRIEIARLLRETGKLDEAASEAAEAVRLGPDDPDAHLLLAQLHQIRATGPGAEEGLRRAAAEYEQVARLRPGDGHGLLNLAGIYGQLQAHADAARAWEMYLAIDPGNFEAHLQRGSHLLLAGDSEKAAAALRGALELQPGSARAYQMLGEVYARAEQSDQAVLHFRKALELEPGNVRTHLELGEVLHQARRYQEALGEAEAVLKADVKNHFALDLKGRSLRDLRRLDEAEAVAAELAVQQPGDLKVAYLQITIAEARRDFTRAATLLEEVLARAGQDDQAVANRRVFLIHLGVAYQQLERYPDAAQAFARARAAGGEPDANLFNFHAEALHLAKQREEALAVVRTARERFPDDPDLTALEATLRRETGDEAGALTLIEELRSKSPDDARALARVADFYRRAKRLPEAEIALRRAREVDPQSLSVLFQLGAVLERQKRHDDAEAVFREALTIEPESAPILNYLGYMNADRNVRLEEALSLIQKAVDLDPGSAAYLDSLGWALYRLNRLDKAEEAVRKAFAKDPKNAVILDHLGDVLNRRGRVTEALQAWQSALDGEDEEGELDRGRVEAKIREAKGALRAQQQPPTP